MKRGGGMVDNSTLGLFLDTLLPGDDLFPAATTSGMLALTRTRLAWLAEPFAAALAARGGDIAAVESAEPALFDAVRKIAYLTYYEQPAVIAAIRSLGFIYNDTPLPEGYPAEQFDPATDLPRHGRGHWIATDQVTRVDLSAIIETKS